MSLICCNDCDKYINKQESNNNYCITCFNSRIPSKIRIMKWFNNEKMYEPLEFNDENIILKHDLDLYSDCSSDSDD